MILSMSDGILRMEACSFCKLFVYRDINLELTSHVKKAIIRPVQRMGTVGTIPGEFYCLLR